LSKILNRVSDLAGGIPKYVFFYGEHVNISDSSNSDPLREGKLSNPCARRAGSMHVKIYENPRTRASRALFTGSLLFKSTVILNVAQLSAVRDSWMHDPMY
jgi:hypothetical protein